jgi:hypothetical protein
MSEGYPRVITISVPEYIPENEIGDFASARAASILTELGKASFHHRSLVLRPIERRLFALSFTQFQIYSQPKDTAGRYAKLKEEYEAEIAALKVRLIAGATCCSSEPLVPPPAEALPAKASNKKKSSTVE